ncbi:MAG: hypothetical protein CVT95_01735 [Bacteroidetes bacterium HGW-Bacteroidetes-12]|nr:MAG: hypothetical protein CVT95_01735 [Bacteroidetes bacterium HGW-Bacteroidetes-12]
MQKLTHLLFLLLPFFGFAQSDTIAHLYTFGGIGIDVGESIEATSDGGYIIIGSNSTNTTGNTDVYLLKVDSLINIEWSYSLGGTNNDWGYAVKQTYDKGYITATSSNSYGNGGYDAVLMKRDSLGNYEWTKRYGGNDWDFVYDLTITYDSGFVFCGETYNNTAGQSDVFVVRTNKNGDTLWTKTIGGNLIDKGNSIIETSDSSIVIAGLTNTTTDSTQAYIIKLSKTGQLLWDSAYGGGNGYDMANSVIETANGEYVIAGTTTSYNANNDKDFYLARTDNNGTLIWQSNFGNPGEEEIFEVYEDNIGNLINVGFTKAAGAGGKDAELFYIGASGWWVGISPTYGTSLDEWFKSFAIGLNGNFCMLGTTNSYGNGLNDVFIVRVDTIFANQPIILITFNDSIPLTINDTKNNSIISIYPNPTQQFLMISISEIKGNTPYFFELYDLQGKSILKKEITNTSTTLNLSQLSKQFYVFKLFKEDEIISTGKLIVN